MNGVGGVKDNPSSPEKLYICLSLFSVYYHKRLIPQVRGINHSLTIRAEGESPVANGVVRVSLWGMCV